MVAIDPTQALLAIGFLIMTTVFLLIGRRVKLLVIELIAVAVTLAGAVWAFDALPGAWYIPFMFLAANVVIFAFDVVS